MEDTTGGPKYWTCMLCGRVVKSGEQHLCKGRAAFPETYQPNYHVILERIEQSLLRIEKLLESL